MVKIPLKFLNPGNRITAKDRTITENNWKAREMMVNMITDRKKGFEAQNSQIIGLCRQC